MAYNLGYVDATGYNLGYVGEYTGGITYPYELTDHGTADPNSFMAEANFDTTGTVELRIISDFDPANIEVDWQAVSDGQLWRQDINTLDAVTVNATSDTTDTGTIGWRTPDGTEGQFDVTLNITEATVDETAPAISSASVPESGTIIAVQMSESMQIGSGGSGGWTISLGDATITSAAVDGADATIINLTPSRTLTTEDTLTIAYTQPSDGFQDQASTPNDLASLSDQSVTNSSAQSPPDEESPVITGVSAPANGSYKADDELDFTVTFDEAVDVTGTPQLALNIGGTTRQADYVSGDGTTDLLLRYTVQAGDNDANGIEVTSLGLNGGTVQDSSGNEADLTLNGVADTSAVLVDTIKPVITPPSPNPLNIEVGGTFTNTAATATDNQDGSLGSVTGNHSVDTATIGEYTVTYPGAGIVDTAGNVAEDATRTVNVVEELPIDLPTGRAIGFRKSIRAAARRAVGSSIH